MADLRDIAPAAGTARNPSQDRALAREVLLEGVTLERHPEAIIVRAAEPIQVLTSAVLGGGRRAARTILNVGVPLHYDGASPDRDLRAFARRIGVANPVIGLMTAAPLEEARILSGTAGGMILRAVVTVGLGNAVRAGEATGARGPGTINSIFLCDGRLSEAAAVELVIIATEAKASALADAGVTTERGKIATGTSTDAVVVGWRGRGTAVRHAGSATHLGRLAARIMREALAP